VREAGDRSGGVIGQQRHECYMWSIFEDEIKMLNEKREHVHKLPGVIVRENVTFTSDLEKAVCDAEVVVVVVPSKLSGRLQRIYRNI